METTDILNNMTTFDNISVKSVITPKQDLIDVNDEIIKKCVNNENINDPGDYLQDLESNHSKVLAKAIHDSDDVSVSVSEDNLKDSEIICKTSVIGTCNSINTDDSEDNLKDFEDSYVSEKNSDSNINTNGLKHNLQDCNNDDELYDNENSHESECNNYAGEFENNLPDISVERTETVNICESSCGPCIKDTDSTKSSNDKADPSIENCDVSENELPPLSPLSPTSSVLSSPRSINSESSIYLNENVGRERDRTSRNSTLPYFQLPNPDFDEYLVKTTDALLSAKKESCSLIKPLTKEHPTAKKSILDEFLENFSSEKSSHQLENTYSICKEVIRPSITSEYVKVISCLGKLDESKSPGIKRLAFKEFLKKKIEEKKSAAFNRSKEISNLENEEIYEESEDEGKFNSEVESSDEDLEEPTVDLLRKKREENNVEEQNDENDIEEEERDMEYDVNQNGEHDVGDDDEDDIEDEDVKSDIEDDVKSDLEDEDVKSDLEDEDVKSDLEDDVKRNIDNGVKYNSERNDMKDDDESDDDILTFKPKRPQILEDDSNDSEDIENCFNSIKQKNIDCSEKNDKNGSFANGLLSDNNFGFASLPSYQPDAVVLHTEDSHDSIVCETYESDGDKNLSDIIPPLQMSMDDPPIPLSRTFGSPLFLSQDLAAVCSGSFKNQTSNKQSVVSEEDDLFMHMKQTNEKRMTDIPDDPSVEEKMNGFFDLEAELSGDDDGEEDPEVDDLEGIEEMIAPDQDLPSNEKLRDEIAGLHLKHLIHDDDDILQEVKERFLDDGELHGDGRTRRFAWKNNTVDVNDMKDRMSSDSEDEAPSDSWNQEKAKWREQNNEEEIPDAVNSNYKNLLKVKILGKPEFSQSIENSSRRLSCKRPRGSFLHLNNSSASQVLKKLKTSEEPSEASGSRTTKHFVFRNDLAKNSAQTVNKINSPCQVSKKPALTSDVSNRSIFSKI